MKYTISIVGDKSVLFLLLLNAIIPRKQAVDFSRNLTFTKEGVKLILHMSEFAS